MGDAYGIVFVGPPGRFAVWETTPEGELMSREAVERLGQIATRAGAANYRVFKLPVADPNYNVSDLMTNSFVSVDKVDTYQLLFTQSAGVPPPTRKRDSATDHG